MLMVEVLLYGRMTCLDLPPDVVEATKVALGINEDEEFANWEVSRYSLTKLDNWMTENHYSHRELLLSHSPEVMDKKVLDKKLD